MMKWFRNLKSKIRDLLNDSHGEIIGTDLNVYFINGIRYVVSSQFSTTEEKTLKDKLSDFIGSDFAHLTNADDINTLKAEYVNSTAGEGRINAVR